MVKFRPHREYYNESMRLVKTFNSIDGNERISIVNN